MTEDKSAVEKKGQPKLILNRYRIEERIGSGPFATVYKAADMELRGALVAIKSIHPHLLASETIQRELRSRVLAMRQLVHANILKSFDLEEDEKGMLHLITEYCDGWSLAELLTDRKGKQLKRDAVFHILTSIADALSYAHQKGVMHLDLKPENVLITKEGEIKVCDFSFSQAFNEADGFTRTGEAVSNPAYMAPEQFALGETGAHTDIYSWAVIGYQISTGNSGITKQSYLNCARTHMSGELSSMFETQVLDTPLESILEKASCLEPHARFESAKELCESIAVISPNTLDPNKSFCKTLTPDKQRQKSLAWRLFIPGGILATVIPLIVWGYQISFRVPIYSALLRAESSFGMEFTQLKNLAGIPYSVSRPMDIFKAIADSDETSIRTLYTAGIDTSVFNEDGDTALHFHLRQYPHLFSYAVRSNLNFNGLNKNSESLLHVSVTTEAAKYLTSHLLQLGVNANTANSNGYTPLHLAIIQHDDELIQLLLANKASAKIRAPNGLTPIMLALSNFANQKSLYLRLLSLIGRGAEVRAYDNYGRSTLDYIKDIDSTRIENLIKQRWGYESRTLDVDVSAGNAKQ